MIDRDAENDARQNDRGQQRMAGFVHESLSCCPAVRHFGAIYLGCWLEPLVLEPVVAEFDPVFDPVVCESVSMTISETILESGSINRTRSGSFTNSRFFASGT